MPESERIRCVLETRKKLRERPPRPSSRFFAGPYSTKTGFFSCVLRLIRSSPKSILTEEKREKNGAFR